MLAIVRKRRGVISDVREYDGEGGRYHLLHIEYKDDQRPTAEDVIWELEPSTRLLEPTAIPRSDSRPMPPDDFDAMVRAARWTAISPYLDPDGEGPLDRMPVSSPFHGAMELEDFQLVPLLKALRMPRVNLMLADDVGLGKTIEAGLILSELLIRRRINRVLILTPAALRIQWRDEMWSKFSLPFDVVDRDATLRLKRSLGIDANPWRCCSRIIASYHYLRQPDVLEEFNSACRTPEGSPYLPWDLLIVDEVHNLMPASFGDDSQLCRMLRAIGSRFEHRLFLTATPHNGHTRSFTGLLEMLDPVRFSRTGELREKEKQRVSQVVIRRLKRDINRRTDPPRFSNRKPPMALNLEFAPSELSLIHALEAFRTKVRSVIAAGSKKRRLAGWFAIEILGKRLLSGPMTFLESWQRCRQGLQEETEAVEDKDVEAAQKSMAEETADDREAQEREATATTIVGAWLRVLADDVETEMADIEKAAEGLGVQFEKPIVDQNPKVDARFDELCHLVDKTLRDGNAWRDDERLVIFTEYKTTLDYLLRRLRERYKKQEDRFLTLFGGMDDAQREQIKDAFNDPDHSVRVLLATDAASEGLNLQSTARRLLHYDCPWNPSRLEQRNGRLDRHGQGRDVYIHHFASEMDGDLKFLAHLVGKVDQIREDLGSVAELFDEATRRRFIFGEDVAEVQSLLDTDIDVARGRADFDAYDAITEDDGGTLKEKLDALAAELDLDANTARETLDAALSLSANRPQLSAPDELDRFELLNPSLPSWKDLIDETIRKQTAGRTLGPVPKLSFSAKPFLKTIGKRQVFHPRMDTAMLHLGHPLVQKGTGSLTRRRFPGPQSVSRWCVRYGDVPEGADAVILLHLEELAVNRLRETFHHWIRTVRFPIRDEELLAPMPHLPAAHLDPGDPCQDDEDREKAAELLGDVEADLKDSVAKMEKELTARLIRQLEQDGREEKRKEEERYRSRQGEVSKLIQENTMARLEQEIAELKNRSQQGRLFDVEQVTEKLERDIAEKEEELRRRRESFEEVQEQLSHERDRILNRVLPGRYALQGEAQIFPVAVEVRLPRKGGQA